MPTAPPPLPVQRPPVVAPPRRLRAWLGHPLVITFLALGGCFAAFVALCVLFVATARDITLTTSQKECAITADALSDWFVFTVDPASETWTAKKFADQSIDIEYEYDDPSPSAPYIYTNLIIDRKPSDAAVSYAATWSAFKVGANIGGGSTVSVVPADHIFSWGDTSHFSFLESGGSNFGFGFITRKGSRTYHITVGGAALEDPAEVDALLRPFLERFEKETF